MAADVSSLRAAVVERYQAVHAEAVTILEDRLDAVVPDSGKASIEKLRESRTVVDTSTDTVLGAQLTYLGPKADWTQYGTEAHPIDATPGGPALHFYWPKIGREIWTRHVNHPGSTKHVGWFSKILDTWPDALREAVARLG